VISLVVADDQALVRAGFCRLIEDTDDLRVVGQAVDGAEAADLARELRPDVVLMDIRMPGTDGIEGTRRIVAEDSGARVLVLTTFDLDEYVYDALDAGASGFLLKDTRYDQLLLAIRVVAGGDALLAPSATRRLVARHGHRHPAPPLPSLTEREHEIWLLLADGLSNAEIGARLFLAETTVKTHVGRVLNKLGVRDRVQAVILAFRAGVAQP
jgi:DNA-binding NarL/FixJ family response regulator